MRNLRILNVLGIAAGIVWGVATASAGSNPDPKIAIWTNSNGTAGDTFLVVRSGVSDNPTLAGVADYRVCNDQKSVGPVSLTTPNETQHIAAGECGGCIVKPAFVRLQVDSGEASSGTYQAFKTGKSCKTKYALSPSKLTVATAMCSPVKGLPPEAGDEYSMMECVVDFHSGSSKKRRHYRLCMDRFFKEDHSNYDVGWANLIVDPKLANKRHDVGGIVQDAFSPTDRGCSDIHAANYLSILVRPGRDTANSQPSKVKRAEFKLYRFGDN